eukprot:14662684-Alexandrium_andersonii.AAC.1
MTKSTVMLGEAYRGKSPVMSTMAYCLSQYYIDHLREVKETTPRSQSARAPCRARFELLVWGRGRRTCREGR